MSAVCGPCTKKKKARKTDYCTQSQIGVDWQNCNKFIQAKQQNIAENKIDSIEPHTRWHTARRVLAGLLCLLLLRLLDLKRSRGLNLRMFSPPVCNLACGAAAHSAAQDMWSCEINTTIQHQTNALRSPPGNHYFLFNVLYRGRAVLYMKKKMSMADRS